MYQYLQIQVLPQSDHLIRMLYWWNRSHCNWIPIPIYDNYHRKMGQGFCLLLVDLNVGRLVLLLTLLHYSLLIEGRSLFLTTRGCLDILDGLMSSNLPILLEQVLLG